MEVEEMVGIIAEGLYVLDESEDEKGGLIESINTYKDEGVLTDDKGVVVKLNDRQKSVFHITVQKQ